MSLRLRLWKGALPALLVWACAKANDSDLVAGPVPVAGKGGASGAGGKGTGGSTGGTAGKGGTGTGGSVAGTGGTGGANGGTAGQGRAGAPACGDRTDDAELVVHDLVGKGQETSDRVFFHLYLENNSNDPLDLGRVEVRYWMTAEPSDLDAPVSDFASQAVFLGRRAEFVQAGELSHLLMTFTGQIPAQNADLNGAEVQFLLVARNGGRFDQTNDYSFAQSYETKTPNDRITAYVDGKLAWGREPSGLCPGEGEGGQGGQGGEGGEPSAAGQGGEGGA
jgi:hypothetical protein